MRRLKRLKSLRDLWGAVFLWLILTSLPAAAQQPTQLAILHTRDAIHGDAPLVNLTDDTAWIFQLAGTETPIDTAELVRWGSWPGVLDSQAVWLNDGSWLCGDVRIAGQTLHIDSDWLEIPPLSLRDVRGLVLAPPTTRWRWLELQSQMLAADGDEDQLWLSGGRKLRGIIRDPSQQVAATPASLELDTSGKRLELAFDEIEAIVFSPTLQGAIPLHWNTLQVGLVDGSLLWATQLVPQNNRVEAQLEGSIQLSSLDGPTEFCKAIRLLAHRPAAPGQAAGAGGNADGKQLQWLSGMPVASYRHVSDSTLRWELGVDRDVYGRALHSEIGIYSKGLATHSTSQVAFRWDGSPGRLLAEVRLAAPAPQAAAKLGSVSCQILLARDDQLQTVEQFSLTRSGLPGGADVRLLNVDLSQAKLVVLVTDKADFGQYGDHLLWLDARIAQP